MDPEQMRQQVVSGIDKVLNAPWIVRQLESPEDVKLLHASKEFWQKAGTVELMLLADLYNKQS